MTIDEEVGKNIAKHRKALGLSQVDVARMLEMTRPSICNYEKGRQSLSVQRLYEICAAVGAKIPDVLPNKFNAFY